MFSIKAVRTIIDTFSYLVGLCISIVEVRVVIVITLLVIILGSIMANSEDDLLDSS